jgi:F-type H+-transporting ATPase subunit alpha
VEILKQPQYRPMSVEQQVMVIYAVTNGYLDQVAVPAIKEWERGFLEFSESQFPQVPQRIRSEKVLSKETEADLKRALENYNQSFGSRKKA